MARLGPGRNSLGAKPPFLLLEEFRHKRNWTPEQCVYLAYGVSPDRGPATVTAPRYEPPAMTEEQLSFVSKAKKSLETGGLPAAPSPGDFIRWGEGAGLHFHSDWLAAVGLARLNNEIVSLETAKAAHFEARQAYLIKTWALAPTWTIAEGIALSMNRRPEDVARASDRREMSDRNEFERRLEFAYRAYTISDLGQVNPPAEFLNWAARVGFPFSQAWLDAIPLSEQELAKAEPPEAPEPPPPVELRTRERNSLLTLVIGMAVAAYNYGPSDRKSDVASEIASDLARAGLSLHPDTIRKWLREAADLLPQTPPDDFS